MKSVLNKKFSIDFLGNQSNFKARCSTKISNIRFKGVEKERAPNKITLKKKTRKVGQIKRITRFKLMKGSCSFTYKQNNSKKESKRAN